LTTLLMVLALSRGVVLSSPSPRCTGWRTLTIWWWVNSPGNADAAEDLRFQRRSEKKRCKNGVCCTPLLFLPCQIQYPTLSIRRSSLDPDSNRVLLLGAWFVSQDVFGFNHLGDKICMFKKKKRKKYIVWLLWPVQGRKKPLWSFSARFLWRHDLTHAKPGTAWAIHNRPHFHVTLYTLSSSLQQIFQRMVRLRSFDRDRDEVSDRRRCWMLVQKNCYTLHFLSSSSQQIFQRMVRLRSFDRDRDKVSDRRRCWMLVQKPVTLYTFCLLLYSRFSRGWSGYGALIGTGTR